MPPLGGVAGFEARHGLAAFYDEFGIRTNVSARAGFARGWLVTTETHGSRVRNDPDGYVKRAVTTQLVDQNGGGRGLVGGLPV